MVPPGGATAQPLEQQDATDDHERLQHHAPHHPSGPASSSYPWAEASVLAGTHRVCHDELARVVVGELEQRP
ncbi:hypothetical protein E2562_023794 [Oryza meyeriana var. granulata]|uniref:Uncharacterized protein n=1 Tax=Oryza meyeriana var. granulata TaxID=110450 RepID=A0A6G1C862_9ORYZ|nr:hypothetical protein E2562_023794 [Oryza meyeriana var. granulata]